MSKYRNVFAGIAFVIFVYCWCTAEDRPTAPPSTHIQSSATNAATPAVQAQESPRKVTAYTLPPDLYKKAHDKSRIDFRLQLIGFIYGVVVLWIVLRWKLAQNTAIGPSIHRVSGLCRL